jgi:hypothetical protein
MSSPINKRSEAGRKGGLAVLGKYGRAHFRAIGKVGYRTTLTRHWAGDALGYRAWLIKKGWDAVVDRLSDRELDRQLSEGAEVACVEVPVMDDFDELPDAEWDRRAEVAYHQDLYERGIVLA